MRTPFLRADASETKWIMISKSMKKVQEKVKQGLIE
jgi:hypothetical protein